MLADGAALCIRFGETSTVEDGCRAAAQGGMRVLEITLTTPGALELIAKLSSEPDIVVGAGTVLSIEQVRQVANAGGRFIFSPVFDEGVVVEAHLMGILAIPGAGSASEILAAHRSGAKFVKVFPSGALGGPAFIRAVHGPFPEIPLIPTSGPTAETAAEYFAAGAVAVGIATAEVFPPGFTAAAVKTAAERVRAAIDAARPHG
jgi:2-dehydro-3-deoxyphosphogluconate aldolase/(4S)-4-hydroxy-2-oxoglutarate aldolase